MTPEVADVGQADLLPVVLLATGKVDGIQIGVAGLLLPAVGVGALATPTVHHGVAGPRLRSGVLFFALASGIVLLLRP